VPDDRNFLKDLLVASPFVAGSGFAIHQAAKAGAFVPPSMGSSFLNKAVSAAPREAVSAIDMSLMNEMAGVFRTKEGAEIARRAWIEAIQSTDPLAGEVLSFAGDIKTMPANKVYTSIKQTLQRNNSLFMASAYRKFKKNVGLLGKHMEVIGKMPTVERVENLSFPRAMNKAINELPAELQAFHKEFTKDTGVTAAGEVKYYTRKGWQQEGFGTYKMPFRYGKHKFDVTIPMSQKGALVEGLTQSSKRVAVGAHIFDPRGNLLEKMTRTQYYLKDIEQTILPSLAAGEYKSAFDIQKVLKSVYERDIFAMPHVPNLPSSIKNAARKSELNIRGQAVDVRILEGDIFREPTSREGARIMEQGGLYPSTSPKNLSKWRLSTLDPRAWSPTPEVASFGNRPMQAAREWRMTPAAVEEFMNQGSKWSIFETQGWRKDFGAYAAPHIRTLYVDPEKYATQLQKLGLGEGESIITGTPQTRRMLEAFRMPDPVHFKTFVEGVEERIAKGATFTPGEMLGWTPEGKGVAYESNMKLLGVEGFSTVGKGDLKSLYYLQTHRPGIAQKIFGAFGGLKAMMKFADPADVRQSVWDLTAGMSPEQRRPFLDAMATGEPLQIASANKLKMANRNNQIITGLWDMIEGTRTEDAIRRNGKLASFMRNPNVFASYIAGKYGEGEGFIKGVKRFAMKEAGISVHQFDALLGTEGLSLGISQSMFGETMERTGAGKLGSIESRAFDLLRAGQHGALGEEIAEDFARRAAMTDPRATATYDALTKTLQSVEGMASPGKGARMWDIGVKGYDSAGFQAWLEAGGKEGGWLKAGKREVFIPGGDILKPYMTAAGDTVKGDVAGIYHTLARQLSAEKSADLLDADVAIRDFIGGIQKQQAPYGEGAGALFGKKRKILGSRFFTGLTKVKGFTPAHAAEVGIPIGHGRQMLEELVDTGVYSRAEVTKIEKQFLGSGSPGILMRHPFTAAGSIQGVNIRAIEGITEPIISLPSFATSLKSGGKEAALTLSPAAGMLADFDADIIAAAFMKPKIGEKIGEQLLYQDNIYTQAQVQHSIRTQIIKARSGTVALGELTTRQGMVADAMKLGTAQKWTPLVSTDISMARKAIVESGLSKQRTADALFVLQHGEQMAIAGKHHGQREVLEYQMENYFKTLQSSLRDKNAARLESTIMGAMDEGSLAGRYLTEGVTIDPGSAIIKDVEKHYGIKMSNVLPAPNVRQASQDIISALEISEATGMDKMARMAQGRMAPTVEQLGKYLAYTGGVATGLGANVSKAAMTAKNFLASAGLGVLKHKKAVGFGFAGSLAIAAALSKPDSLVGPGSVMIPDSRPMMRVNKAGSQMKPEDVMPPGQAVGSPSPPSRMYTPTVRVNPGQATNVSARVTTKQMSRDFTSRLGAATGADRINVNVRDNSNSLSPSTIANRVLR